MISRILLESEFSVETRPLSRQAPEIPAQADFALLHFHQSQLADVPDGATLLVNPLQPLSLSAGRRPSQLLVVRLNPALLLETATRLKLHRDGSHLLFRHPLTPLTDDTRLRRTLETLSAELQSTETGWRDVIRSLIQQLAVYLLRTHINVQRSDEIELSRVGMVDRRLRRALEFMHDNCGRELSLAEIAAAAYLSEFHFARLFKKITGTTPHGYLASLRIERARRLLAETDLSIVEIGAQVGYASQSHFTKVFRTATGLTPRAFRQAIPNRNTSAHN